MAENRHKSNIKYNYTNKPRWKCALAGSCNETFYLSRCCRFGEIGPLFGDAEAEGWVEVLASDDLRPRAFRGLGGLTSSPSSHW